MMLLAPCVLSTTARCRGSVLQVTATSMFNFLRELLLLAEGDSALMLSIGRLCTKVGPVKKIQAEYLTLGGMQGRDESLGRLYHSYAVTRSLCPVVRAVRVVRGICMFDACLRPVVSKQHSTVCAHCVMLGALLPAGDAGQPSPAAGGRGAAEGEPAFGVQVVARRQPG